jgi:hypothetical protein
MALDSTCAACGAIITVSPPIGRRDQCEKCGADLRCCRQCHWYEPRRSKECREPSVDELIRDKEKPNTCEYYRIRGTAKFEGQPAPADLRAAAEALFKKKPQE